MKKLLMVLLPLFFLITIYLILDTYSLFESNHVSVGVVDIGKWQVKLNDSIINSSNSDFVINDIIWDDSDYVLEGKVAPGMSGYFDIVINPNSTDVSIRYDISFDFSSLTNNQFVIDSIVEVNNFNLIRTDEYVYTGVISLDDIKKGIVNTVRVRITWVNDEANNDIDTYLSQNTTDFISIPVSINIEQYMGEEIVEYVVSTE